MLRRLKGSEVMAFTYAGVRSSGFASIVISAEGDTV